MSLFLKTSLCAIILSAIADIVSGQIPEKKTVTDTARQVTILFPFDGSEIDSSFMDNPHALRLFHRIMTSEETISQLDSIIITAAASPDGHPAYNRQLALHTASSLKEYVVNQYPWITEAVIEMCYDNTYWDKRIDMAEQDSVRQSGSQSLQALPKTEPEQVFESGSQPEQVVEIPVEVSKHRPGRIVKSLMALRTNLLLDLAGGPNLGIEILVGRRFSVAGDFAYAYTRISNSFALNTIQGTVEARYWFNPCRNRLTGWNVGVYGTYSSRFDLQLGKGFQGDGYWSGGLSGGYSVALSNSFNLGFSVMGGYFYSPEVREYSKSHDGYLVWEQTRYNVSRIALTQVRVNLVWLINKKVSK